MSVDLDGAAALVTGAGRGIGRAIALELAGAGASVGLVSRSSSELQQVAAEIGESGGSAVVIVADMGAPDEISAMAEQTETALGPIDVLVNNAAVVWPLGASTEVGPEDWEAATRINLFGPLRLTGALLPGMLERGSGLVVNVSSGIVANPAGMVGGNAYASTKAALEAQTLNLAAELEGTGVSANVFRPGAVDTAMQTWIRDQDPEEIGAALHERFVAMHEGGDLLTPERSAQALLERIRGGGNGEIWDAAG